MIRAEQTPVGTLYYKEGAAISSALILMTVVPNGRESLDFRARRQAEEQPGTCLVTEQGRREEATLYLRHRFPGLQGVRWNGEVSGAPEAVRTVDVGLRWPVPVFLYGQGQGGTPVLLLSPGRGWTALTEKVARHFAAQGRPVFGVPSPNLPYWFSEVHGRQAEPADMGTIVSRIGSELGLKRPWLVGHSLGAGFALSAAAAGFDAESVTLYGNAPSPWSVGMASRLAMPICFLQGTADSPELAQALYDATSAPKRLILIEGADHHFTGVEDRLIQEL